jgi:hypothetical protein
MVPVGLDTVFFPPWHPYWSDVKLSYGYWTYHVVKCTLKMAGDMNTSNNILNDYTVVKARKYDLQVNYIGLLRGTLAVPDDTIAVGVSYNPVSVVSNSPAGPTASFRAWYKIIRMKTGTVVYSRYLDKTLAAGQYACLYYYSGWVPSDSGWYKVTSYLETRPGVDSILANNSLERLYYAKLGSTEATQGDHSELPKTFALKQNYPNPILSRTTIRWQIPIAAKVRISVYDATGRIIKTLTNSDYAPGYYNTMWDCTDNCSKKVSAGIYFYELQANNYKSRLKMVIAQ